MAKYALIFHGGAVPDTDEEGAEMMAAWEAWMESLGEALADPGNAFGYSTTVRSDGSTIPGGGPNPASGYSLLEAESLDAAAKLATGCPILEYGGSIEVAETIDM